MNLKDIKGDFKELYGGRIISNVMPVDEIECEYETIKNVKLLNEKYDPNRYEAYYVEHNNKINKMEDSNG